MGGPGPLVPPGHAPGPRYGPIYHSMRTSRAQFKYALRYAKSIEETARADSLAAVIFSIKTLMTFGLV